jgi:hypothetical protein
MDTIEEILRNLKLWRPCVTSEAPTSVRYPVDKVRIAPCERVELSPVVKGGDPSSFSVLPKLPENLVFSTTTGSISGELAGVEVPEQTYTVTAKNDVGEASTQIMLAVMSDPAPINPNATFGDATISHTNLSNAYSDIRTDAKTNDELTTAVVDANAAHAIEEPEQTYTITAKSGVGEDSARIMLAEMSDPTSTSGTSLAHGSPTATCVDGYTSHTNLCNALGDARSDDKTNGELTTVVVGAKADAARVNTDIGKGSVVLPQKSDYSFKGDHGRQLLQVALSMSAVFEWTAHGDRLVIEIHRRLAKMTDTKYIRNYTFHRGDGGSVRTYCHVNEDKGIYKYDCCGLVYNILGVLPDAQKALDVQPGHCPSVRQFKEFFEFLPELHRGQGSSHWRRVMEVTDIAPGDVMVWGESPGHMAIVMEKPVVQHTEVYFEYHVKIADSTTKPHQQDSRRAGTRWSAGGMGTGVMYLSQEADGKIMAMWSPVPQAKHEAYVGRPGIAAVGLAGDNKAVWQIQR